MVESLSAASIIKLKNLRYLQCSGDVTEEAPIPAP